MKREYALAQEQKLRAELGVADQRGVRIVRPDLAEAAKKLKSRERARGRSAVGGGVAAGNTAVDGYERLAQRQDGGGPVVPVACSWAEYPPEHTDSDAPAQEADRGVFDRLADAG